jgi:hypothetical protein
MVAELQTAITQRTCMPIVMSNGYNSYAVTQSWSFVTITIMWLHFQRKKRRADAESTALKHSEHSE